MKRARVIDFPLPTAASLDRPLWRAVQAAIGWQIDIGRVPAGSRVPSIRALARRLGVSRNTVQLAIDSLVADGYLAPRVGDGTYVLDHAERIRVALWQRPRRWIRDPDGLLVAVTISR
jgi:GntR family transcriptional regulator / MocR family aminotransferase